MVESEGAHRANWLPYLVDMLRTRFGLVTNDARLAMVENAAARVANELGLPSSVHLLPLLRDGTNESDAVRCLLKHVTIHESYFFRDDRAVEGLKSVILPTLIERRRRERTLRIWSAGCAGGEETYTISILLRSLFDVDGWTIDIVGTDLDRDVLVRARDATYSGSALRVCSEQDLERYFEPTADRRQRLRPKFREGVRFEYDNLIDPAPVGPAGSFDLVVCRNVAIYFDRDGVAQLHGKIARHLAPDGVALLGVLEPRPTDLLVPAEAYEAGLPLYRRSDGVANAPRRTLPPSVPRPAEREGASISRVAVEEAAKTRASLDAAIARLRPAPASRATGRATASTKPAKVGDPTRVDSLARARALADAGALDEALAAATASIAETPLDEAPYLLAALVCEELGRDEQAEALIRRVIYLAPANAEAQLRLSLLLGRRGETDAAARAMAEATRLGIARGATT